MQPAQPSYRSSFWIRTFELARLVAAERPVLIVTDSHVVGASKPDPRIFDFALEHFDGIDRANIAYVGDSVTMDIGGARAAGLHGVLLDPHDDHPDADFDRITSLWELVP